MVLGKKNDVSIIVGGAKPELVNALGQALGFTQLKSFAQKEEINQRLYLERNPKRKDPESLVYGLKVLARFARIYWQNLANFYKIQRETNIQNEQ